MWRRRGHLRDADDLRRRLHGHVPVRRPHRRACWPARRSTSTSPTRTSSIAHFHYVLFGTIVFAVYSGIYFWFPKFTGRYMDERLGKLHFWLTFIGFHMTFLVQHWLGAKGMPRRYADYLPTDGFTVPEHVLDDRLAGARRLADPVRLEHVPLLPLRRDRHRRRPVGLRQLPRVGDLQPAAAAQLHLHPAHPLRAAGLRGALPAPARAARGRGARRAARHKQPASRPSRWPMRSVPTGPRQGQSDPDPS